MISDLTENSVASTVVLTRARGGGVLYPLIPVGVGMRSALCWPWPCITVRPSDKGPPGAIIGIVNDIGCIDSFPVASVLPVPLEAKSFGWICM